MSRPAATGATLWPTPAGRTAERKAKSEAILQVAAELFAARGFHRTSVDDVAAKLGLTKPTIYHYFATKNDMLLAILSSATGAIEAAFRTTPQDAHAYQALSQGLVGYVEVATTPQGRVLVQTLDMDLDDEGREAMRRARSDIDQRIRSLLTRGVEDGTVAPCNATITAFMIAGAINAIARWYRADGPLGPSEIAAAYIAQLGAGLRPRDAAD